MGSKWAFAYDASLRLLRELAKGSAVVLCAGLLVVAVAIAADVIYPSWKGMTDAFAMLLKR